MTRLSNYTREKMALALVKHRFADRAASLVAESQELFRQCYDLHHNAEDKKHIAALAKRHPQGLPKDSSFNINLAGRRETVGAQNIAKHWSAQVAPRYCLADADSYPGMVVDPQTPLGERIIAFADGEDSLREEADLAYREALGALNQFTTAKRLAEDWPEAMPVIADLIPEDSRTLPVVQVGALNAKFKLPPHLAAAA
jgi:hypothetical protein